jgi:di/tricarboxylate transporter
MSDSLSRVQSAPGECPCIVTDSCLERRLSDVIIPWYTWLIMALVFLLLAMIISLTVLTCIRRKQQMKRLKGLYVDETRESIIDYK